MFPVQTKTIKRSLIVPRKIKKPINKKLLQAKIEISKDEFNMLVDNIAEPLKFSKILKTFDMESLPAKQLRKKILDLLKSTCAYKKEFNKEKKEFLLIQLQEAIKTRKIIPFEALSLFTIKKTPAKKISTNEIYNIMIILSNPQSNEETIQNLNKIPAIRDNFIEFTNFMAKSTNADISKIKFDELFTKFRNELSTHRNQFYEFFKK